MSLDADEPRVLYEGHYLALVARGRWEYATRTVKRPAVAIVAITDDRKVVLVEQYRIPVGCNVVEIPAGLTGDVEGAEDEALLVAAQRELLEETGYEADRWTELGFSYSSPGLTDESLMIFLAEGLRRVHGGGGDASENIQVHEVPLDAAVEWGRQRSAVVDLKLLAGLQLAKLQLDSR
ncbi:MAG: NUDIX hydrolase [Planctomycetales bacterium]|nr:NUDIX hydrolase [Planctomycetales bacterium]